MLHTIYNPMMSRNPDILFVAEYINNVLYFATVKQGKVLKNTTDIHYFCIDEELVYENYYSDFGPLNLGCVYKYCEILNEKLQLYYKKQTIVHYTSIDPKRKANAAFLLGCFGVLCLKRTPIEALKPMMVHGQTYRPFQDATIGESMHTITILDCLNAIRKARQLGFFNFEDFDYEEYQRLDKIQGGDLNWIVPGKFLAFIGPVDYSVSLYHPPEMYVEYFVENNVKIVIRLNKRMYDGKIFRNAGIVHYDLFFPDGSCPPKQILFKFLQISEDSYGAIAVHCKAGLGRTGSLIGSYLIKHYRMTAHEAIGWMRICRPGSVIGDQQSWLEQLEPWLVKQGNIYRKRLHQNTEMFPVHEYGVYSIAEKKLREGYQPKHTPIVLRKSRSPPLMQRQTRSEMTPPLRPQASRVHEAPNKSFASEKEQCKWQLKQTKQNPPYKYPSRPNTLPASHMVVPNASVDPSNTTTGARRGFAAGEPRTVTRPRVPSRPSNTIKFQTKRSKEKVSEQQHQSSRNRFVVNSNEQMPLISTYSTSPGPAIKSLKDAKNFLIRTSMYKDQREKQLQSSLVVTPRISPHSYQQQCYDCLSSEHTSTMSSNFSTIPRGQTQPSHRRRLGRSPSPSPTPSPTRGGDRSRARNMTSKGLLQSDSGYLHRDASRLALNEALNRLKWSKGRDGSAGAASLGARREAPRGARPISPSARSDEHPAATQGDLLNSIKFQREWRKPTAKPAVTVEKHFGSRPGSFCIPLAKPIPTKQSSMGTSTEPWQGRFPPRPSPDPRTSSPDPRTRSPHPTQRYRH